MISSFQYHEHIFGIISCYYDTENMFVILKGAICAGLITP